jgi:hypothetical protein
MPVFGLRQTAPKEEPEIPLGTLFVDRLCDELKTTRLELLRASKLALDANDEKLMERFIKITTKHIPLKRRERVREAIGADPIRYLDKLFGKQEPITMPIIPLPPEDKFARVLDNVARQVIISSGATNGTVESAERIPDRGGGFYRKPSH